MQKLTSSLTNPSIRLNPDTFTIKEFQAKGYNFNPIKEKKGKPRWMVEKSEENEF
jgi:hypothetical protein